MFPSAHPDSHIVLNTMFILNTAIRKESQQVIFYG